jgi:hypothetical protein
MPELNQAEKEIIAEFKALPDKRKRHVMQILTKIVENLNSHPEERVMTIKTNNTFETL